MQCPGCPVPLTYLGNGLESEQISSDYGVGAGAHVEGWGLQMDYITS